MRYETDANRIRELEIATEIGKRLGYASVKQTPIGYVIDFYLMLDHRNIHAFLEAKDRNLQFGTGDGYYISASKVTRARAMAIECQRPAYLGVDCLGTLAITNLAWHDEHCILHGRFDRPDDTHAIEPCLVYPWHVFKILRRTP